MTMTSTDLDQALEQARARYVAANPASAAAYEDARAVLPGGTTRSTVYYPPFPLTVRSGTGARIIDLDGHEYVDLLGEYTAGLYGHDHPVIRRAFEQALDAGWGYGAPGVGEAKLARVLCERFPSIERVRFTNSGTEANLLALATATTFTGRSSVLVFAGGYHGSVLSFGPDGRPLAIDVPHRWVVGSYNDVAGTDELITQHAHDLAAILVEPMLGSGGCVPGRPEFLELLRRRASEVGALLILDEVMTSRMSGGGLQGRLGLRPDLTTLGKYVGGGMSSGAFGGRADVLDLYDGGGVPHAGTFNNNVFSMAAGYAGLTELFAPAVADELFARGEQLRSRLNEVSRPAAVQWTGLGSIMTVHFQRTAITNAGDIDPAPERRELFHLEMLHRGFYLARRGLVALSLAIGADECDRFIDAAGEVVRRLERMVS